MSENLILASSSLRQDGHAAASRRTMSFKITGRAALTANKFHFMEYIDIFSGREFLWRRRASFICASIEENLSRLGAFYYSN
jgi:hypothetical protein